MFVCFSSENELLNWISTTYLLYSFSWVRSAVDTATVNKLILISWLINSPYYADNKFKFTRGYIEFQVTSYDWDPLVDWYRVYIPLSFGNEMLRYIVVHKLWSIGSFSLTSLNMTIMDSICRHELLRCIIEARQIMGEKLIRLGRSDSEPCAVIYRQNWSFLIIYKQVYRRQVTNTLIANSFNKWSRHKPESDTNFREHLLFTVSRWNLIFADEAPKLLHFSRIMSQRSLFASMHTRKKAGCNRTFNPVNNFLNSVVYFHNHSLNVLRAECRTPASQSAVRGWSNWLSIDPPLR